MCVCVFVPGGCGGRVMLFLNKLCSVVRFSSCCLQQGFSKSMLGFPLPSEAPLLPAKVLVFLFQVRAEACQTLGAGHAGTVGRGKDDCLVLTSKYYFARSLKGY